MILSVNSDLGLILKYAMGSLWGEVGYGVTSLQICICFCYYVLCAFTGVDKQIFLA